jgi:hypothetical protein
VRRKGYSLRKCLIALWLTASLTPAMCESPPSWEELKQQVNSEIEPTMLYPGSAVQAFALDLIEAGEIAIDQAAKDGGEAAAAEAARPLLVEIAGLTKERDTAAGIARKSATRVRVLKAACIILAVAVVGEGAALLFD